MADESKDEVHVRMLDVGTLWSPSDATEAAFRERDPHQVCKLETKRSPLLVAWSHARATAFVASERGACRGVCRVACGARAYGRRQMPVRGSGASCLTSLVCSVALSAGTRRGGDGVRAGGGGMSRGGSWR